MKKTLLACGLLSSMLYVATDLLGASRWEGYSISTQAISELTAVGAPTARLLEPFYVAYALLFTAFGLGVWASAGQYKRSRLTAACLTAIGLLGIFAWPFFPMHMRGDARSATDTIHLALGGVYVILLALAVGFASTRFGPRFRVYSQATILVMLLFGGLTSLYVPRVDAALPTPYLGILERICIASYLLWIAVYSTLLIRAEQPPASDPSRVGSIA